MPRSSSAIVPNCAEGPAIQYLQVRDDDRQPRWSEVTHWVKSDRQMALVFQACRLLQTLWDTARIRYLPKHCRVPFELRFFGGPTVDVLIRPELDPEDGGIFLEDMSIDLLYYAPAADPNVASDVTTRSNEVD